MAAEAPVSISKRGLAFLAGAGFAAVPTVGPYVALLAIVSGRPAAFLGARVNVPGVRLLGVYGLEQWLDGRSVVRPEAARWRAAVRDACRELPDLVADVEGAAVEDKGLSVAVHWRNAVDRRAAEEAVTRAVRTVAAATGLAREPGKLVEELRPPVEWDKGTAVQACAADAGIERVAYVGDDRGDLAAFSAVHALGGVCIAVDHGAETPDALLEAADARVAGHEGVIELLADLHATLG